MWKKNHQINNGTLNRECTMVCASCQNSSFQIFLNKEAIFAFLYFCEKNILLNEMTSQHEKRNKNMCACVNSTESVCKIIYIYCVSFNSISNQSITKTGGGWKKAQTAKASLECNIALNACHYYAWIHSLSLYGLFSIYPTKLTFWPERQMFCHSLTHTHIPAFTLPYWMLLFSRSVCSCQIMK